MKNKKRSSPEMEHIFSPNSGVDQKKKVFAGNGKFFKVLTCAQMHTRVKLLEGMQMKTILKLLGGIQSNYWWGYIPPWIRHFCSCSSNMRFSKRCCHQNSKNIYLFFTLPDFTSQLDSGIQIFEFKL